MSCTHKTAVSDGSAKSRRDYRNYGFKNQRRCWFYFFDSEGIRVCSRGNVRVNEAFYRSVLAASVWALYLLSRTWGNIDLFSCSMTTHLPQFATIGLQFLARKIVSALSHHPLLARLPSTIFCSQSRTIQFRFNWRHSRGRDEESELDFKERIFKGHGENWKNVPVIVYNTTTLNKKILKQFSQRFFYALYSDNNITCGTGCARFFYVYFVFRYLNRIVCLFCSNGNEENPTALRARPENPTGQCEQTSYYRITLTCVLQKI